MYLYQDRLNISLWWGLEFFLRPKRPQHFLKAWKVLCSLRAVILWRPQPTPKDVCVKFSWKYKHNNMSKWFYETSKFDGPQFIFLAARGQLRATIFSGSKNLVSRWFVWKFHENTGIITCPNNFMKYQNKMGRHFFICGQRATIFSGGYKQLSRMFVWKFRENRCIITCPNDFMNFFH